MKARLISAIFLVLFLTATCIVLATNYTVSRVIYHELDHSARNVLNLANSVLYDSYNEFLYYKLDSTYKIRKILEEASAAAVSAVAQHQSSAQEGLFSEDVGKKLSLEFLQRYASKSGVRFLCCDRNLIGLAHPDSQRLGKSWEGLKDLKGDDAFREMVKNGAKLGTGFSVALWSEPGQSRLSKHIVHYSYFEPWGWIVCSAANIDEIEAALQARRQNILNEVANTFSQIAFGERGYLALLDGEGKALIHPTMEGKSMLNVKNPISGDYLFSEFKTASREGASPVEYLWAKLSQPGETEEKVAYVQYFKPLDWYAAYTIPKREIEAPARALIRQQVSIVVIFFLLCALFFYFFIGRISRPILALTAYARELPFQGFESAEGWDKSLDAIAAKSKDETGQLAKAFLFLRDEIRKQLSDLAETSRAKERYAQELEASQRELEGVNRSLEQTIKTRTLELSSTNAALEIEVADRKRRQAELAESELRLRMVLDATSDAVWDVRLETLGAYYSPTWAELLGLRSEEIEPTVEFWHSRIHPGDRDAFFQLFSRHLAGEAGNFSAEFRIRTGRGDWLWVLGRGRSVEWDANGAPLRVVGTLTNIHERRLALEGLERAKRQAEAASQAKSEFLAKMSHEIRTPMNIILGMTELLGESRCDESQRNYLNLLREAGEHLLSVINDILNISKIEAGQMELEEAEFEFPAVIEELHRLLLAKAERKGLSFVATTSSDLPLRISGDVAKLRQILVNLVDNAIKFTERGGVLLKLAPKTFSPGKVEILITVSDTGMGVPADKLAAIFEQFIQGDSSTTRQYGGTGLGLAICKHLAERMGGEIWVESVLGKGSTFYVRLPFACGSESDHGAASLAAPALQGDSAKAPAALSEQVHAPEAKAARSLRILIAEDVESNQFMFRHFFKNTNHVVEFAENGAKALDLYGANRYDIVFLDIHMPVMDGFRTAEAIRAAETETQATPVPLVALTADAFQECYEKCMRAGFSEYLSKPVRKTTLFDAIAKHCATSNPEG
jgi:PAS domain S-box-containing protein